MANRNHKWLEPELSPKSPLIVSDYSIGLALSITIVPIGRAIGEGTFGKVKLATHTLTGQKVRYTLHKE